MLYLYEWEIITNVYVANNICYSTCYIPLYYDVIVISVFAGIYRVSEVNRTTRHVQAEQAKLRRKVLYHFAIFAVIIEKLIKKYRPIRANISARKENMAH